MSTKIEWTDRVLTCVTGCTPISAGCDKCYAKRMANRLKGRYGYPADDPFKVILRPDRLDKIKTWKKPSMVFVSSMGDLFHKDVPDEFIMQVFKAMNDNPQHTFQVLTKRPERLLKGSFDEKLKHRILWTDNIWMGVSIENSDTFHRAGALMMVPNINKFISFEPLIGYPFRDSHIEDLDRILYHYNWIIVGGETGAGARPMEADWVHLIFEECKKRNIPFFFKGWGTGMIGYRMKKTDSDYYLFGGKEWREMPEVKR